MSLFDKLNKDDIEELKKLLDAQKNTDQNSGFVTAATLGFPVFTNKQLADISRRTYELESQKVKTKEDIETEIARALH